ncbi:RNA polymerase sigma factor [Nitratireductor aquimarinus]|uniref:RNA polymerase sigma factor n=1 Tax=Nitratireductor aquimarinus TaxID=889300 RepID=A0ABU4ARB1_9HYPH|nr:RNA polymerase sigma factor [Nitratireductor aquimarinus]MDV6228778.1 RNA polymerase sigma factor [Nitratireductor aquimarinus]
MNGADARAAVEAVYRREKRRVLATLIRLLGGFDAAEEALHEAFAAAADRWPREGVPTNPYSWLVSTGRFKMVDRWRRQARLAGALPQLAALADPASEPAIPEHIRDDELRLIFTCCHPGLPADASIALTLREVGGLTTEEIARAYLTRPPTIAQRIVRAKAKIRDEAIPFDIPARAELPGRIESVLRVIYLIFNEGYAATDGPALTRADLSGEAIRLGRLMAGLMDDPDVAGLLALMLLHEARRESRVDAAGDIVLLEDQDRSRWDRALIDEARALIDHALQAGRLGPYLLQAAIAGEHGAAARTDETNWRQVVSLYDILAMVDPSPVVALNRAAALSMRDGAEAGLAAIDAAMADGRLDAYHLAHAARADMLRRLGRIDVARDAYRTALELARQPAERRFLERRLAAL